MITIPNTSPLNGQRISYIDRARIKHTGVIVGQSPDGAWLYIQSDRPGVPPAEWHFKLRRELVSILTS